MTALRLLSAKGISKRFGGVHALSDVDFTINHGEIVGILGPSGAPSVPESEGERPIPGAWPAANAGSKRAERCLSWPAS